MNNKSAYQKLRGQSNQLFKSNITTYGILVILSLFVSLVSGRELHDIADLSNYAPNYSLYQHMPASVWMLVIIALGASVTILISEFFQRNFLMIAQLKNILSAPLSAMSGSQTLALCVFSALAEELFFRFSLVPIAGIILPAAIYTMLHSGPGGFISTWSLEVFFTGLLLGAIYNGTGSFFTVVSIHILVNSYTIFRYKSEWSKHKENAFISHLRDIKG